MSVQGPVYRTRVPMVSDSFEVIVALALKGCLCSCARFNVISTVGVCLWSFAVRREKVPPNGRGNIPRQDNVETQVKATSFFSFLKVSH